jgi:hypothetical protein
LRPSFHSRIIVQAREIEAQRKCFEAIWNEAAKVADTLSTRFDKLKLKVDKLRKRHNLQHSVDTAWSRNKPLDLKKQLSGLKDALKKESSGMKEGSFTDAQQL